MSEIESPNLAQPRLSGQMGPLALMLTVLAFSAPMPVVAGFIPLAILFGGPGATLAFLAATVLLVLFSVGYVTMARHVPKPGDFYAFISSGLGNVMGLASAFLAVVAYLGLLGGAYIFLGVNIDALITSFGGPASPWWVWSFAGVALVAVLGYFHIELSAKVLSIVMVIEVIIIMIFNLSVLGQGGPDGLLTEPLSPAVFAQGDMAVTMLFAVLVFLGFEATALFRDEVRDPDRTIPRATYGAVIFIGLLYALSCYALTIAYGAGAWDAAKADPINMFSTAIGSFVAPIFQQFAISSIILSTVAAMLSIHNVMARYVLNLAVDRALPAALAKVHPRHRSPFAASTAVAVCSALALIPLMSGEGGVIFAIASGIGGVGVIALMALVSLSVILWFQRNGIPQGENAFKVVVAPAITTLALAATVIFAVMHLDLVVGGAPGENFWVIYILIGAFVAGGALALFFRAAKPDVFANLGRADRVFDAIRRT